MKTFTIYDLRFTIYDLEERLASGSRKIMEDALKQAIAAMDSREEWLPEQHVSAAIRNGGEAVLKRDVVCIWARWDPVDGDHEHTATILFCGGDPVKLAKIAEDCVARCGLTHVVWTRGFKSGSKEFQKHDLAKWARLVRSLNAGLHLKR